MISHYKILDKIGEGGMGVVYKARDTKLDRTVALKFLPSHIGADETEKKRFINEARAASTLDHSNICTIHSIEETDDGQIFIVMAYYEGMSLSEKIDQGPLPLKDVVNYSIQIASGLQKAHEKGIVHRDLKPANIFITNDDQIKIIDFGLARMAERTLLTKSGTTLGTVPYMSPEQAQGNKVDHRTDIWSLGVVMYEMITGQRPFKSEYDTALVYSIINEEPEPVTGVRSGISMELERIVQKCLEKDPSDRYQHSDEIIVDLRKTQKDLSSGIRSKYIKQDNVESIIGPVKTGEQETSLGVEAHGKSIKRVAKSVVIGIMILIVILGVYLIYPVSPQPDAIAGRIPVAVADFVNETAEQELDGLSGMLITSLEQSRVLSVLPRIRMYDILRQMGSEDIEMVDEALGKEMCLFAGIDALVTASIRRFGNLYTIDLKILDTQRDEYIFTAKEEGYGHESIPSMLDQLSDKVHTGLRERAPSITDRRDVSGMTTANLEAYYHYFNGERHIGRLELEEAEREFRKAIELDPEFGLAYFRLSYRFRWEHRIVEAQKYLDLAHKYIDRIPEKERLMVYADQGKDIHEKLQRYYTALEQYPEEQEILFEIGDIYFHNFEREKSIPYFEQVLDINPLSFRALDHITRAYNSLGRFNEGLQYAKRYFEVSRSVQTYEILSMAYLRTGDVENGEETALQMLRVFQETPEAIIAYSRILLQMDKYDESAEFLESRIGDGLSDLHLRELYRHLVLAQLYQGQYRKALSYIEEVQPINIRLQDDMNVFLNSVLQAYYSVVFGADTSRAKRELDRIAPRYGSASGMGRFFYLMTNAAMGVLFHTTDEFRAEQEQHWNDIHFIYHFFRGEYADAVLYSNKIVELQPDQPAIVWYWTAYSLAQLNRLNEAKQFAEKVLETVVYLDPLGSREIAYPRALYLLGVIHEKKGEREEAISYYEKFLTLWKNADPEISELIDAKKRLGNLQPVSS